MKNKTVIKTIVMITKYIPYMLLWKGKGKS